MHRLLILYGIFGMIVYSFASSKVAGGASIDEIMEALTLEEKVGQLGQLDINVFMTSDGEMNWSMFQDWMTRYKFGSVLDSPYSGGPNADGKSGWTATEWRAVLNGMQEVAMEQTGIPILYGIDSIHGATYVSGATLFPAPLTVAASFDPTLAKRSAEITTKDTLAAGMNWLFSPVLGLALQPAWARFWETYGEDPLLTSEFGRAMIEGIQTVPEDTHVTDVPARAAACMKHFIAYSDPRTGHDRSPVTLGDRLVRELYMPAFQTAIDVGVMSGMESYQEVSGVPMISSKEYLRNMVRGEMGFKGMLVSDFQEIENLWLFHNVAESMRDAVKMAFLDTSVDMSMIPTDADFFTTLVDLVRSGEVPESRVDASVRRVLKMKQELGMFARPVPPLHDRRVKTVGQAEDQETALDAARESVVLLKNDDGFLPLPTTGKKILVTGPAATAVSAQTGGWALHWQGGESDQEYRDLPTNSYSVLDGVQKVFPGYDISHIRGPSFSSANKDQSTELSAELLSESTRLAQDADVVVLCLGEENYAEKPGDVDDLTLPADQLEYAQSILDAGTPVVLVLIEGRPRLLNGLATSSAVKAVLFAGVPGPQGGLAVAEILAGQVQPSARLPFSYPQSSAAIPYPYHRKPSDLCTNPDNGFEYVPCPVEWPFGTGLTFQPFKYSDVRLSSSTITETEQLTVSVTVTNTGHTTAKHSVLLFLTDVVRRVTPEYKLLKGFTKIELEPGDAAEVEFTLGRADFMYVGVDKRPTLEAGEFRVQIRPDVDCREDSWSESGDCFSFQLTLSQPETTQEVVCQAVCSRAREGVADAAHKTCLEQCRAHKTTWTDVACLEENHASLESGMPSTDQRVCRLSSHIAYA